MSNLKYILTNSGKFHHFEVAKILYQKNQLSKIICGYPWIKLKNESIPKKYISANGFYNILRYPIRTNLHFKKISDYIGILNKKNIDDITCKFLEKNRDANVLLALAGVSLNAGKKFKDNNKIYICERSSAHIYHQNEILKDEYKEFLNQKNETHSWFIENEIKEYEEADIILAPSNFVKDTFKKDFYDKVKVLQFGTDIQNFYNDPKIKKNDDFFNIIFIGGKSIRKGLHYLIDAFNNFKHPKKNLHVVGSDTEDKDFFKEKLKNEKIHVYGHVNQLNLNKIINKCHVLVLPSIEDGFGIVTLQALAAGCPIIVTENTGPVKIIKEYDCGFVVPIRNPIAITDKLQLLADDKDLLQKLSLNALSYAKKNTWSDYVDKLDNLILDFKKKI